MKLFLSLRLVSAIATIALLGSTTSAAVPVSMGGGEPPGLVSHWKAEGNTADLLGANPGVAVGAVAYASGKEGQGFSLDGTGHVAVAASTLDAHASAFTVTAWMRMSAFVGGSPVLNHRTAGNDGGLTLEQWSIAPGSMLFSVNTGGDAQAGSFRQISSAGWETGVLYHVAATFDAAAGTMVLYRNGKVVAWRNDLANEPFAVKPSPELRIGSNIFQSGLDWKGLLDEIRFYGRALTAKEVACLASATPLVARWSFDEACGPKVADATGRYDGTLVGGAKVVPGGIVGSALQLDEATGSLVNVGTSFPGFVGEDFSIVAWVKTTTADSNTFVVSKHTGGVFAGYILGVNAFGSFDDYAAPTKASLYVSALPGQEVTSAASVTDGAWHQIACVYRAGGTSSIYVANAAPFLIGGFANGVVSTATFTGLVDEVRVYAAALSDGQVQYLFDFPDRALPVVVDDLVADWSETANPNGLWELREGANALPHVAALEGASFSFWGHPGWARSENGSDRLPFWFKTVHVPLATPVDFQVGDVVVHTTDDANGIGNGLANVVWTSPSAGHVDVSGAVWIARDIGRSNDWRLLHNGVLLSQGNVASGDPFDRTSPMCLRLGSGGASALRSVAVAPGDTIRLEFQKTSQYGDFVGTILTVSVPEENETLAQSYFLPRSLKVKVKSAGKDSLSFTGFLDDGGATVDYTQPVTVTICGFTQTFTLAPKGTSLVYKDANLAVVLKPNLKGTSRGAISIRLKKATLAGLIDPEGLAVCSLSATGLEEARSNVRLVKGGFSLGRTAGTLLFPVLAPEKLKAATTIGKPDTLALTAAFAGSGAAPQALEDVRIRLADGFDLTIPGAAFVQKKTTFQATGAQGNGTYSLVLDFKRDRLSLKTKGIEVGAPSTSDAVSLSANLGLGTLPWRVVVRLGGALPKIFY